jgi:hypothetical protein
MEIGFARKVFCFQRLAKAFIGADFKEIEDAPFAAHWSAPSCLLLFLNSPLGISVKIRRVQLRKF